MQPTSPPHRRDEVLTDFATLRIPVTAEQLDAALQQAQDAGLTHLDFLHRLLADQAGLRRERSLQRRIKCACFRDLKPLAEFDWNFNPTISRVQIESLAVGDFVAPTSRPPSKHAVPQTPRPATLPGPA